MSKVLHFILMKGLCSYYVLVKFRKEVIKRQDIVKSNCHVPKKCGEWISIANNQLCCCLHTHTFIGLEKIKPKPRRWRLRIPTILSKLNYQSWWTLSFQIRGRSRTVGRPCSDVIWTSWYLIYCQRGRVNGRCKKLSLKCHWSSFNNCCFVMKCNEKLHTSPCNAHFSLHYYFQW